MRTTVTIDDALLLEARQIAHRTNRTLGAVVEDGLRRIIGQPSAADAMPSSETRLPSHGSGGLRAGVDLENKDALAMLLGDEELRASA